MKTYLEVLREVSWESGKGKLEAILSTYMRETEEEKETYNKMDDLIHNFIMKMDEKIYQDEEE